MRRPLLLCLALVAHAASGHGGMDNARTRLTPELDALPAALAGVRVQLRETLAPQLLIENGTGRPLYVLDENGRRFLKIGPHSVRGDLGAAAFHRSNTLMGAGSIPANADHSPDWQRLSDEPSWGWFDLRLRGSGVEVPHSVAEAGERTRIARWSIPVRLGDTETDISGHFVYRPRPHGVYEGKVTAGTSIAPGLVLTALKGGTWPGLFISDTGNARFVVMGEDGKPFLRFTPEAVFVNRRSTTWAQVARSGAPRPLTGEAGDDSPRWARVSRTGSYGWIEPRAVFHGTPPAADNPAVVKTWSIPVRLADGTMRVIEGATEWVPLRAPGDSPAPALSTSAGGP